MKVLKGPFEVQKVQKGPNGTKSLKIFKNKVLYVLEL